jgi:hypothetical protein
MTLTRLELKDDEYRELELLKDDNKWADFVYTDLSALLEPMNEVVLQLVKNSGATLREDRTGVAQLLLSVDRSFIKLEAVVTKTQTSVMSGLSSSLTAGSRSANPQRLTLAARRLSRPYLRLARDFAETSYGGRPNISKAFDTLSGGPVEDIAKALESLEDVAASVERTIKKVLTNSTLGLGDGLIGKPEMGKPEMGKPEMGKPEMGKPEMGKPEMGTLARLTASGSLSGSDEVSAIKLFRQAAAALKLMEEAISEIESDVRLSLTNPPLRTNGDGRDYNRRSTQMALSFRALNEVVANARDTVFRILADPSQGLGPPPEQRLVSFDRQNLALAGGLSALDLSLL